MGQTDILGGIAYRGLTASNLAFVLSGKEYARTDVFGYIQLKELLNLSPDYFEVCAMPEQHVRGKFRFRCHAQEALADAGRI